MLSQSTPSVTTVSARGLSCYAWPSCCSHPGECHAPCRPSPSCLRPLTWRHLDLEAETSGNTHTTSVASSLRLTPRLRFSSTLLYTGTYKIPRQPSLTGKSSLSNLTQPCQILDGTPRSPCSMGLPW